MSSTSLNALKCRGNSYRLVKPRNGRQTSTQNWVSRATIKGKSLVISFRERCKVYLFYT